VRGRISFIRSSIDIRVSVFTVLRKSHTFLSKDTPFSPKPIDVLVISNSSATVRMEQLSQMLQ